MTLRVPTNKAESVGMRKLSSDKTLREALDTLKGKPKVKRTMWSRRAQEYEAKINSGDLVSIAFKGISRVDDAQRAVDAGFSAISVSNHGGNNLDGTLQEIKKLLDEAVLAERRQRLEARPEAEHAEQEQRP